MEERAIMDHFVQGVLTVTDPEYILDPDLRLISGETIHLLYSDLRPEAGETDEDNPLTLLLEENQWYEMLLVVQIGLGKRKVTYLPSIPPGTQLQLQTTEVQPRVGVVRRRNDVVQGIILDLNWDVASVPYLAVAGSVVYTHRYVLIETAIGKMVVSYKALQDVLGEQVHQLAPGGYLEWERARMDILAIIAKREAEPE
jgi:hypothetical protein